MPVLLLQFVSHLVLSGADRCFLCVTAFTAASASFPSALWPVRITAWISASWWHLCEHDPLPGVQVSSVRLSVCADMFSHLEKHQHSGKTNTNLKISERVWQRWLPESHTQHALCEGTLMEMCMQRESHMLHEMFGINAVIFPVYVLGWRCPSPLG